MADDFVQITQPPIEELIVVTLKIDKEIDKTSKKVVERGGIRVQGDARKNAPVGVSGAYRNSLASEIRETSSSVRAVIGSTLTKEEYPSVIEEGRRAGAKMPPPKALYRWVRLVLQVPIREVRGVAFIVARNIGKRGLKARRVVGRAVDKNVGRIYRDLVESIDERIARLLREV